MSLAAAFLAELSRRPGAPGLAPTASLEAALADVHTRAAAAHPALVVPTDLFLARLADAIAALPGAGADDPDGAAGAQAGASGDEAAAALVALEAGDLYLAAGALAGLGPALAALDQRLEAARPALDGFRLGADFTGETLQELRRRLLVGDGGPPSLASYAGRGPLAGWLKVAALRLAISQRRKDDRMVPLPDDALELPAELVSASGLIRRADAAVHVRAALGVAIAALPARARAVLRMYYLDGVELEAIGAVYGVHASTVSRWLARARDEVAAATRKALTAQLGLDRAAADSLLRSALSVELSLPGLLAAG
ncbi:MAG: sigma-70 family RNA polymerase sigma factor [Kofleriaceae bacterium]|jgi:RNA polymerase sigma-70 factor (ECF subfamily)|nr:sigma-70 family RNA polymerase sigma factor [Kofleriaceae bacterium]MBP6837281.1 sigma-70 family RNA polymerase sigma factor [Kofleriaceae bacterium]MBP9208579.1 sigma-70 family RNA polymerase sigma factor [Kofleriaceae bacterium]